MCVIIDTCVSGLVLAGQPHADYAPIAKAFREHTAKVTIGGQLKRELLANGAVKRALAQMDRAGQVKVIKDALVDAETSTVAALPNMKSKDYHVVALARVSGARLLCTSDAALMKDFKNKQLVRAGKIYKSPSHSHLIRACCK
jgi:hypothetical protein